MRLLIFTQAIDKVDPVLGFFHSWLSEFSSKFDKITVIALRTGEISLPSNIEVFSLRRGKSQNKAVTFFKLIVLILKNRHAGDAVFVHMNKEYVLAGWLIWKISKVPVYFWYNHRFADWFARLAMKLSKKVFYTSEHSAGAKLPNAVSMPVGVDTELFKIIKPISSRGNNVLSLGRIDPVKNIDVLAETCLQLYKEGRVDFNLTVAGSPGWGNERYASSIREKLAPFVDKKTVNFVGSISHEKTPEFFNNNFIFINLTESGSFDKTILEAMACGCLIIAANQSVWKIIGEEGQINPIDSEQVAEKIKDSLSISKNEAARRGDLNREFVLKNHSLKLLTYRLDQEISI